MKPVILIDMDDTICHLVKKFVANHNEAFPDHLMNYDDVVSWDLQQYMHPDCTVDFLLRKPGLYRNLDILDEHVKAEMAKIHEDYDIHIVTAAFASSVMEKWEWMQEHFPYIPYENFFVAKKKYMIEGHLLIDDASHNLESFSATGRPVICMAHPWNQHVQYKYRVKHSWAGMKEAVDNLIHGK